MFIVNPVLFLFEKFILYSLKHCTIGAEVDRPTVNTYAMLLPFSQQMKNITQEGNAKYHIVPSLINP